MASSSPVDELWKRGYTDATTYETARTEISVDKHVDEYQTLDSGSESDHEVDEAAEATVANKVAPPGQPSTETSVDDQRPSNTDYVSSNRTWMSPVLNGRESSSRLERSTIHIKRRPTISRADSFRLSRHGPDEPAESVVYEQLLNLGNYVKMGWLVKQGHMWRNWKTRFFVLFPDGTLVYYKHDGKRKIQGSMRLNEGVVSVQHVDVRLSGRPYVFQIEKGFYRLWCSCRTQVEAELWVYCLRSVRKVPPPCLEFNLTSVEEKPVVSAVERHLNKIMAVDRHIRTAVANFLTSSSTQNLRSVFSFVEKMQDQIIDRYRVQLQNDRALEMLSGNDLIKVTRRYIEDRIFHPMHSVVYGHLHSPRLRSIRYATKVNLKELQTKSQEHFGIPTELQSEQGWKDVIEMVNWMDCASLPAHKLEVILSAGRRMMDIIASRHGDMYDVPEDTISSIFRYAVAHSSISDCVVTRALLKNLYTDHPACGNDQFLVSAFLAAVKWIERYECDSDDSEDSSISFASSRVIVSISTTDVGIQFTGDGSGRGAIVHNVKRQSQAAMSGAIVPSLSLIAVNDQPVVLMPFQEVINKVQTAALPKRLTFFTEFCYYQVLSLDNEMLQYLMCLAAGRGDLDSVTYLLPHVEVDASCTWEKTRGKQVFGFEPPSSRGCPLHIACRQGQLAVVMYLLENGANPNVRNHKGETPLHVAGGSAYSVPIIRHLVEDADASVNAIDTRGYTPLMLMVKEGYKEEAEELFSLGADIHFAAWSDGYTALEAAVTSGYPHVVSLCLEKGSDPNAETVDGSRSLHLAVLQGSVDSMKLLLDAGADPNTRNRVGQTPLALLAAEASKQMTGDSFLEALDLLQTSGGDCRIRDMLGRHVLHYLHTLSFCVSPQFLKVDKTSILDLDIFGCTAAQYQELEEKNDKIVLQLQKKRPSSSYLVENLDDRSERVLKKSQSIPELLNVLISDVTVHCVDVVSFVVFLDSFSSVEHVLGILENVKKDRNHGLLRLISVLLVLKQTSAEEKNRFIQLATKHYDLEPEKMRYLLISFTRVYQGYFSMRGRAPTMDIYRRIQSEMLLRYGPTESSKQPARFPHRLYLHTDPVQWSMHCTLLTHALFCNIPISDFIDPSKKKLHSNAFHSIRLWFQHVIAYVINVILVEKEADERARAITFFLRAANHCHILGNYDTLAAVLYALQSTAVQRLRKSIDLLSMDSKKLMNQLQLLSDNGCREMNRTMHKAANPSMPYVGLYLQSFVGLNELPVYSQPELLNTNRLRRLGELVMEILHRQSASFSIEFSDKIDDMVHVKLPYDTEESRYARSLRLEPRESGSVPLDESRSSMATLDDDDTDIQNELRESIGAEGTFGFRQWVRMQRVVQRNRSRSRAGAVQPQYEWV